MRPLLWTQRTRCHDIYIDRRPYVHCYCACAALRANVAGRIGNRFNPAESAFLVPSAISRSPHNAQHSLVIGASVGEAPSCGLNGRAVTIDRRPYVHHYCACAALRANVAGRIGTVQLSKASVPSATSLTLAPYCSAFH